MSDESPKVRFAPKIQAAEWDQCTIFRETFLSLIHSLRDNEAFRAYGKVQEAYTLEATRPWHYSRLDGFAHGLQAALADLRYLQGYLLFDVGFEADPEDEEPEKDLEIAERQATLRRLARRVAKRVGTVADGLEKEVGGWDFDGE